MSGSLFWAQKIYKRYIMQLFRADATIFLENICPQKVEKTTLKSGSEILNILPHYSPEVPKWPKTEEFMFQNVAYWPTVYRTGIQTDAYLRSSLLGQNWTRFKKHLKVTYKLVLLHITYLLKRDILKKSEFSKYGKSMTISKSYLEENFIWFKNSVLLGLK